jgi:hypothetical protein
MFSSIPIKLGFNVFAYNAYCSGSVSKDDDDNPQYVHLSAGSNGTGLAAGNGNTTVTGKELDGTPFSDPGSYAVPGNCGSSNGGTLLRASSNAEATAYVDGTLPNGHDAGRKYKLEWKSNLREFRCTQARKNADGIWEVVLCEPPSV